jgi:hypothetical protein
MVDVLSRACSRQVVSRTQDAPVVTDAQIRVDRPGISQRL